MPKPLTESSTGDLLAGRAPQRLRVKLRDRVARRGAALDRRGWAILAPPGWPERPGQQDHRGRYAGVKQEVPEAQSPGGGHQQQPDQGLSLIHISEPTRLGM